MSEYTKKIMSLIRRHFDASSLTLQELGKRMGYDQRTARKSAWQFLNSTEDPRLSMLEKAAGALGVSVPQLFHHPESRQPRPQMAPATPVTPATPVSQIAIAMAELYETASTQVRDGHWSRHQAIRFISGRADKFLQDEPEYARTRWNQWRVKIGQEINMEGWGAEEYSKDLSMVAKRLRDSVGLPAY